jgi:hypothetical protein
MSTSIRLDRLLGREVHTANNRRLGRLEEFRAERRGEDWIVTGYVIGAAGLAERLGLGVRLILGTNRSRGYLARWDQMDLSNPDRLRICCPVEDLRRE